MIKKYGVGGQITSIVDKNGTETNEAYSQLNEGTLVICSGCGIQHLIKSAPEKCECGTMVKLVHN